MNTIPPVKRVTMRDVEDSISHCYYVTGHEAVSRYYYVGTDYQESLKTLTLCILVLNNGYTVVGKSAYVDPNMFDALKGRELAFEDAVSQVYPLLAFLMKTDMYHEDLDGEMMMALAEVFSAGSV